MGGGGGCVIKTISLKAYQEKVGDSVMTVNTDTDTYTFVSGTSHTIKCYNIEFSKNDTLVIPEGANVILESPLTIEKETNGIARITINGSLTLKEGSAITFGTIISDAIGERGANGIVVNSLNGLVMEGGDITIDTIKDGINYVDKSSGGIAINKDGSMIQKGGSINIETMEKIAFGISAYQGGEFVQEGGLIKINTMTTEKDATNSVAGVVAYQGGKIIQRQGKIHGVTVRGYLSSLVNVASDGSSFVQEKDGRIQVDNVNSNAGVLVARSATFNQNGGQIAISNVTSDAETYAVGVYVATSAIFTQEEGQITISNVTNDAETYAIGLVVSKSGATFTQNGGQITISDVTGTDAAGVYVATSGAIFTQNGGQITISNVTTSDAETYAIGLDVINSGTFNQNRGSIEVSDVGDNAFGVGVYSSATTFNVKNLTVSGAEKSDDSVGFLSEGKGGVVNSGRVRVYGTAIKYSKDGDSETSPSPTDNNGGAGDNKYFTGKTYFDTEAL